jgi:hypothetical protein
MADVAKTGGDYEFDGAQNEVIGGLAAALRALGGFFFVYGVLFGVGAFDQFQARAWMGLVRTLVEATLYVVTSRFLRIGSRALEDVVHTTGNDIPRLMDGLGVVRKAIVVWGWAMLGLLTVQLLYMGALFAARHFGLHLPER